MKCLSQSRRRFNVKARKYGSIVSAAVIAGGLMFLPLKPPRGQDAAQGRRRAKGGGGRGGGGRGDTAPTGPTPRMADGKADFSGFWQRPYTPDMSAGATDMNGKPFPQEDPHASRSRVEGRSANAASQGRRGGGGRGGARLLPFTAGVPEELAELRSHQRRLHRRLPALRLDALHQLARSAPDHAGRAFHGLSVRAEHLVSRVPHRRPPAYQRRRRPGSAIPWATGKATRW